MKFHFQVANNLQAKFSQLLQRPVHLALKHQFIMIFVACLGWYVAVHSRVKFMTLYCLNTPDSCRPENVFILDRWTSAFNWGWADALSFKTQYLAGTLAVATPILLGCLRKNKKAIGEDLLLLLQTVFWNGFLNETARLIAQRPRPFVYMNPEGLGGLASHYTSFYSGHTSFVAAVSTTLVMTAVSRGTRPKTVRGLSILMALTTALTATGRVLSGRHFPTDVLFAAIAGLSVASLIQYLNRK